MTDAPEPRPRSVGNLSAAIVGADEAQLARVGRPIPPLPPLSLPSRLCLWFAFLLSFGEAVYYFAHGGFWKGCFGIIGAGGAAVFRWGVVDGIRRSRWSNPQYRARYLDRKGR